MFMKQQRINNNGRAKNIWNLDFKGKFYYSHIKNFKFMIVFFFKEQ